MPSISLLGILRARAQLPDLDKLTPEALKALIVSQHELIASRDSEIDQLELLIAKPRRMQFGRSSEKRKNWIDRSSSWNDAVKTTFL